MARTTPTTELSRLIATSCTTTVRTICCGVAPPRAKRARAPRRALSARLVVVPRTERLTRAENTMLVTARTLSDMALSPPAVATETHTSPGNNRAKFVATKARLTPSQVRRDPRNSASRMVLMPASSP